MSKTVVHIPSEKAVKKLMRLVQPEKIPTWAMPLIRQEFDIRPSRMSMLDDHGFPVTYIPATLDPIGVSGFVFKDDRVCVHYAQRIHDRGMNHYHPIDVQRRIWLNGDIGLMLGDPISVFDGLPPIAPIFVAGEQDEILDFWMSALDRLQAMPGQQGDGYSIIELSPKIIEHIKWVLDNRGNRASISSEELVDHIKLRYSSANMRRKLDGWQFREYRVSPWVNIPKGQFDVKYDNPSNCFIEWGSDGQPMLEVQLDAYCQIAGPDQRFPTIVSLRTQLCSASIQQNKRLRLDDVRVLQLSWPFVGEVDALNQVDGCSVKAVAHTSPSTPNLYVCFAYEEHSLFRQAEKQIRRSIQQAKPLY